MPIDLLQFVAEKETEHLRRLLRAYFRISPKDFGILYAKIKEKNDPPTPVAYLISLGYTEKEAASILEYNQDL